MHARCPVGKRRDNREGSLFPGLGREHFNKTHPVWQYPVRVFHLVELAENSSNDIGALAAHLLSHDRRA